jgi:hypothetical protein
MEITKDRGQKKFKKVKEKVNLYKNLILNSQSEDDIIKDNIKNKKFQKQKSNQKNLDYINNSNNNIKEEVAYSKIIQLKKNLGYNNNSASNTNYDFYTNAFSKRADNMNMNNYTNQDNDITPERKYKRVTYDSKGENSPKGINNKQRFITYYINTINNEFKSATGKNKRNDTDKRLIRYDSEYTNNNMRKRSLRTDYIRVANYDLSKNNKNLLTKENLKDNDPMYGITERKKYSSNEKVNDNNLYNKNKKNSLLLFEKIKCRRPGNLRV